MGIITVEHSGNIFWLGRYVERVKTTLVTVFDYHDATIDRDPELYKSFLERLGIPKDKYADADDFLEKFLYDATDPASVISAMERMYDNACVMREILGSQALAYIELAMNTFKAGKGSANLRYMLMSTKDYLFAFWGCIEDSLPEYEEISILHCGKHIERLDLCFRLDLPFEEIESEFEKLCHNLSEFKKDNPYAYNTANLSTLVEVVSERDKKRYPEAIAALSGLFAPNS